MKKFDEFKINESTVDYELVNKISNLPCYSKLKEDFRKNIDEFMNCVDAEANTIGYDEGDTDHTMAIDLAIKDALDEAGPW